MKVLRDVIESEIVFKKKNLLIQEGHI